MKRLRFIVGVVGWTFAFGILFILGCLAGLGLKTALDFYFLWKGFR